MNVQFATMIGARLAANLLQAVNVIVLARAVSPSDIGLTSAIIGFCMVLFTVTDFGLSILITKSYAHGDHVMVASALHYTTLTTWTFGAMGLVGGLGLCAGGVFPLSLSPLIVAIAVDRCVEYRLGVPIAADLKVIPSSSIFIRRGTQFVVFIGFMGVGVPALWAYSLGQFLGAIVGYFQSTIFLRRLVEKATSRRPAKEVFSKAFPFFVKSVTTQIQVLDSFLVSAFSGAHSAGLYAAASRVTSPLNLIPWTLAASVLPHAARATPRQARDLGLRVVLVLLVLLAFGAPVGFILAEPVCVLLYGDAYGSAGLPLAILLVGVPLAIMVAALSAILQAQGDERFVAKVGVAFALAFVSAISIGGISGGPTGAAIGSTVVFLGNCIPLIYRVSNEASLGPPRWVIGLVGLLAVLRGLAGAVRRRPGPWASQVVLLRPSLSSWRRR
jgi:O-antigen/teichoic acid export membrane protein